MIQLPLKLQNEQPKTDYSFVMWQNSGHHMKVTRIQYKESAKGKSEEDENMAVINTSKPDASKLTKHTPVGYKQYLC